MATKITEKLIINADGKDVVLDGMDFTSNGYVEIKKASSVTIKNCRVYGLSTPSTSKYYWMKILGDIPVKVIVRNCFFGSNPSKLYNILEMNAKLGSGSDFSENYFADDCCAHNTINIYGAEEGATIHVDENVFETSAGTVRIGVKGEPACKIRFTGNTVLSNDERYSADWYGLCAVQPYGKSTTTFANMAIVFDGNEVPCEQIVYGYSGSNEMVLDESTAPKIVINGSVSSLPIYH